MSPAASDPILEALNGGAGSLLSKLITFPFDLIKTRAASSALTPLQVVTSVVKLHGLSGLYQGLGPKLVKSVTGKVLYYFLYALLQNLARDRQGRVSPARNLLVGYFAEILELPVIMPLEAVATRVQLSKQTGPEAFAALAKEGKLYLSLDAYVIGATQPAIQNTIFDQLKLLFRKPDDLTALESFLLGVVASSIAITLTYPMDFCRTVAQGRRKADDDEEEEDYSLVAITRRTIREHGALGLFKGLTPSLLQGVLSASLMLMIKSRISEFNKGLLYGSPAKA